MTDDLPDWLRAQLDEDERIARAVPVDLGHSWSDPGPWVMAGSGGGGREAEVAKAAESLEMPLAEYIAHHIAEHDPARVLREIDAKRQALDHYAEFRRLATGGERAYRLAAGAVAMQIQIMALPYTDRPGYDEAWRP